MHNELKLKVELRGPGDPGQREYLEYYLYISMEYLKIIEELRGLKETDIFLILHLK